MGQIRSVEALGEGAVSGSPRTKERSAKRKDKIFGLNMVEANCGFIFLQHLVKERRMNRSGNAPSYILKLLPRMALHVLHECRRIIEMPTCPIAKSRRLTRPFASLANHA